jgi:CBS domain-containing protein
MIVDSLMHRGVVTIAQHRSVREAAQLMRDRRVGCLVALSPGGDPAGIVTERDLAFRVLAEGRDPDATQVSAVMSRPLATIEPSASVEEAAEKMRTLRVKRLVVVMDNQLRGILTVTDIAYAEPALNKSLIEGWVKSRWEG